MFNSLRMSRADLHSTLSCPIPKGLPIPGTFPIEAKLGTIADNSELLGKPTEFRSPRFPPNIKVERFSAY
jgi:hypothetical protein